ncbi:MAG: hemolysin family protein [Gemmatimonadota bacterium]|nr:hemolysin family protein [Gemmatimonadota bacterium]
MTTPLALILLLLLILANGVFALAEIAVVSSRRARLERRAEAGDAGAERALELARHPSRFLSTVQVGITLVGIVAGAFGGATLAVRLEPLLRDVPLVGPWSMQLAFGIVVVGITYATLVIGELVPKRIALSRPERIAAFVARPMHALSVATSPVVRLLSASTEALFRATGLSRDEEPPVTEEEVAAMVRLGAETGIFGRRERDVVERALWLGDTVVNDVMTPRPRIAWLDLEDPTEVHIETLTSHAHSRFPVCEGEIDRIVGMVDVRDLFPRVLAGENLDLPSMIRQPLFVPETAPVLGLLERFRKTGVHLALVVDEYGGIEGLVTLNDVLEEISGDLVPDAARRATRREDGTWLVDATLTIDEFPEMVDLDVIDEEPEGYATLAGLALDRLDRIPKEGDRFEAMGVGFEVVDMDGRRVDKLLVSPIPAAE